jgi:hypothetical protein
MQDASYLRSHAELIYACTWAGDEGPRSGRESPRCGWRYFVRALEAEP